jgi:hypothetical protein
MAMLQDLVMEELVKRLLGMFAVFLLFIFFMSLSLSFCFDSVLRKHPNNAHVVARASLALASLARVAGNARWFGPAGASEALYAVLVAHKQNIDTAKCVVSAIGNLCLVDHNKLRLGNLGVCEEVLFTANYHKQDLDTAIATADAIWKLCETIQKGSKKGTKEVISLEDPNSSSASAFSPSAATSSLVLTSPALPSASGSSASSLLVNTTGNEYLLSAPSIERSSSENHRRITSNVHYRNGYHNRAILFEHDVCHSLVSLLNYHLADVIAAETICHAIAVIATGNSCEEERVQLGDLGACEAIVKAMIFHEGNENVTKWGCLAIKALCHHYYDNQLRFYSSNIAAILVVSLRGFRLPSSSTSTGKLAFLFITCCLYCLLLPFPVDLSVSSYLVSSHLH